MINYIRLGKKIYNTKNTSETRRMLVFIVRCLLNTGRMNRLHRFFMKEMCAAGSRRNILLFTNSRRERFSIINPPLMNGQDW